MKNKLLALIYLSSVVLITLWHSLWLWSIGLAVTAICTGRDLRRIVLRAVWATVFFGGPTSLLWLILAARQDDLQIAGILRLNLRILFLTLLGQAAAARLDIIDLLSFSPTLCRLAVLIRAQAGIYRRQLTDYRQAVRSRTCRRPSLRDSQRISAAAGAGFLRRAQHDAAELTLAMQSRGVFDDQG